jgi:hypothetical protein
MSWLSIIGGLFKLVGAWLGLVRDKKLRQDGADAQALDSTKKAEADEQIARNAADDVKSGRVSVRDRFTRPEN